MLKKINRLSRNNDFDAVFKNGRSAYSDILGVKIFKNDLNINRFGILVSLKISKKAVDRNRIKRRIRAAIEEKLGRLKKGYDCVVVVFPLILAKNYDEINKQVENCFKKLKFFVEQ